MNYLEIHVPKEYENPVRRLTLTSDRGEQIYIAPFNSITTTYSDQYEYVVLRYFPYSIKIKNSKVNHVYVTHKLPGISLKRKIISMLVPKLYFTATNEQIDLNPSIAPRSSTRGTATGLILTLLIILGVFSYRESLTFNFLWLYIVVGVIGISSSVYKRIESYSYFRSKFILTALIGIYYSQFLSIYPKISLSLGFILSIIIFFTRTTKE